MLKIYFKGASRKVDVPPWTHDESWAVDRVVYGLGKKDENKLLHLFQMYGGIPRAALQNFAEDINTPNTAFALISVSAALNGVNPVDIIPQNSPHHRSPIPRRIAWKNFISVGLNCDYGDCA